MVSATLPIEEAPSEADLFADVKQAAALLRGVVRHPVPGGLSGAAAKEFVALFSEAERAAGGSEHDRVGSGRGAARAR